MSVQEMAATPGGSRVIWLMRFVAVGALLVAIYLAWSTLVVGSVAGCGGGAVMDCNHVLQSKYSKVLGVPVSIPASALYVVLIAALFMVNPKNSTENRWAWKLSSLCVLSAAAAAIWFIAVQILILHKLCWYCLVVHSCGLLLAGFLLWLKPLDWKTIARWATPGIVAAAVVAMMQYASPEPDHFEVITELAVVEQPSMVFDMHAWDGDFVDSGNSTETSLVEPAASADQFSPNGETSPMTGSPVIEAPSPTLTPTITPSYTPVPDEADPGESALGKPAPPRRYIDFRFAKVKLNTYDWPILGDP